MDAELWLPAIAADDSDITSYVSESKTPLSVVAPFSSINLFVGANNAGKSRFLRFLFRQPCLWLLSAGQGRLYSEADSALDDLERVPQLARGLEEGLAATRRELLSLAHGEPYSSDRFGLFVRGSQQLGTPATMNPVARLVEAYRDIKPGFRAAIEGVYVPALRTAARFAPAGNPATNDVLALVAQDRFFSPRGGTARKILSGLELYDTILELLTGPKEHRDLVRDFERFLSRTFFENNEVNLRPRWTRGRDTRTLEISVGRVERPLHELGDGVGGLVVLLAPFFSRAERQLGLHRRAGAVSASRLSTPVPRNPTE